MASPESLKIVSLIGETVGRTIAGASVLLLLNFSLKKLSVLKEYYPLSILIGLGIFNLFGLTVLGEKTLQKISSPILGSAFIASIAALILYAVIFLSKKAKSTNDTPTSPKEK